MTRATDQPVPAVTPHVTPPGAPTASWPGRTIIAVERLPSSAYVWDDTDPAVVYDAPGDPYVYDAAGTAGGFTDVFCDFQAATFSTGIPDELGLYPPGDLTLTLDNPAGRYSTRGPDGRLVFYAPGRRVCIWWRDGAGADWWLWSGRVTSWDESTDGTSVTITAFAAEHMLAADPGRSWTPGAAGDLPSQRIANVLSTYGFTDPTRLDVGLVTLATVAVTDAPLEACQRAALSDGGVVYTDADGTLLYRDRGWRGGRPDQPVPPPLITDNVCDVGAFVVWDLDLSNNDDTLATEVVLSNTAGTVVTSRLPADSAAWYAGGVVLRYAHPDPDLWQNTADGQALADYVLTWRSAPTAAIAGFTLYLLDPQQPGLFAMACKLRVGDLLRLAHAYVAADGLPGLLDVTVVVASIRHVLTPDEGWTCEVTTTRPVSYVVPENWDDTAFLWDDPDPRAVWSV